MLSFIMRFERDPDRDRFAALYQMNHTRMERLARQLLGDQNRAEDAVHDTFMKLIRHYDELRDRSDERLASWLLVVVKTTALDMLRRDKWENACEESCRRGSPFRRTAGSSGRWWRSSAGCRRITAGCWSCGSWRNGA